MNDSGGTVALVTDRIDPISNFLGDIGLPLQELRAQTDCRQRGTARERSASLDRLDDAAQYLEGLA
jgi:hypothetical protein